MYDPRCEELARTFLEDNDPPFRHLEARVKTLAQRIQDTIEQDLSDWSDDDRAYRDRPNDDGAMGR